MSSKSSNSSKRGACKRGVDEGGGVEVAVVGGPGRGTPRRGTELQEWEAELQQEGEEMWKGIHKFKMWREGKAGTCNLLNAKWVLTREGTHGRRVKHGLEGIRLGSSGPLCKRHNQWGEGG